MKIGIYNIFTSFWFFLMFLSGGTLTYISFDKKIFSGDIIFVVKFFVGLLVLITFGLFFYFLYKFRVLIVTKENIISFYPFLFKNVRIDLNKTKNMKLDNFFAFKGTVYRNIVITDFDRTIEISDLEFDNFEKLVSNLKLNEKKKKKIDLEQAKSNILNVKFNVYLLFGSLIFFVINSIMKNDFNLINITIIICIIILLYASIKRKIAYKNIMFQIKN